MRQQLAAMLADIGFVSPLPGGGAGGGRARGGGARWVDDPSAPHNRYAGRPAVVKAALVAALYPNVAGERGRGEEAWRWLSKRRRQRQ